MATDNDGTIILFVGGAALLYFYLARPKGRMLTQAKGSTPATSGCGCPGSRVSTGAVNQTTPINPAVSAGPQTLTAPASNGSPGDYAGPPAPGSNRAASGNGGNWLGVANSGIPSALTPPVAPLQPSTGSNVWHANATPTGVMAQ